MNTTLRRMAGMFLAMALSSHLLGQVEFISVEKLIDNKQTGNEIAVIKPLILNTPTSLPPLSVPYQFRVNVEGNDIVGNLGGSPTFTFTGTYPGSTTLLADGTNEYDLQRYFGLKSNGSTAFDDRFANGAYTVTVGGTTVNLNLGGLANADVYPNMPVATVSAGTWAGGGVPKLLLNVDEALTITTNQFNNYYTNGYVNHIGFWIDTDGNMGVPVADISHFSDDSIMEDATNDDFATFTIGASTLTAGQTYYVEFEFNTVVDLSTDYADAFAVALFTQRTSFSIEVQAIPEPSTYAAVFGALALTGVMMHRRRRTA